MGTNTAIRTGDITNLILDNVGNTELYEPEVLKCFSYIVDYNSELTKHSLNVAFLSLIMGVHNGKPQKELKELFTSALLHDYGKIYIEKSILEKPGALTKEERKVVELHTSYGYLYLKQQTNLNNNILNAIRDHHEKLDGSGYGMKKSRNISCHT